MRLSKNIFFSVSLAVIVSLLIALSLSLVSVYKVYEDRIEDNLKSELEMIKSSDDEYSSLNVTDRRLTVIDKNGDVIFDSTASPLEMENHLMRREIQDAINYGYGVSSRTSDTLLSNQIYVAIPDDNGYVIRLSMNTDSIFSFIIDMLPYIILIIILIIVISSYISSLISRKIVEPVNTLDLDDPVNQNNIYEELSPLIKRLDEQNKEIERNLKRIKRDQKEFSLLIENMNDGIIIIRESGDIMMINDAAKRLLGKAENQEFENIIELSRESIFFRILEKKENEEAKIMVNERIVDVRSTKVDEVGSLIMLFDISKKEELEKKEKEFIQNVSHELKTPLTTISGYSELLMSGKTDDEKVREFSSIINQDAKRLYSLIEDILSLSRLDGIRKEDFESLTFNDIAREAVSSFHVDNIKIEEDGVLTVKGNRSLLYEVVYNLLDNAIKYNKDNNEITLTISDSYFSVKDRGIGMSSLDREHVFDRFYRADKSRSRKTGGTGLGLAIVKSICVMHGAKVLLDSTLQEGTTVTVIFP